MNNKSYFHVCAYAASVPNTGSNNDVTAINDSIFTRNTANHYILPEPGKLRLAAGFGASLQRFRINTPTLRYVGLPFMAPVNASATIPSPVNAYNPGETGPTIPVADEIAVEATQGGGAAEEEQFLLWFSFGRQEVPMGPEYRIRFTATITGVDNAWANGSMTPDSTLPAGIYSICGMDAIGTNMTAARLIFPGGGWRPGCLARNSIGQQPNPVFTDGSLGVFGTFDSVNIPNLEIICNGANASQEVYLDLVRIGAR